MTYLDLFLLTLVVVFVVDLSGIVQSTERALSRWSGLRVHLGKPWACSLCMTWWAGIVYLLAVRAFDLPHLAAVAGFAFLAGTLGDLARAIRDIIIRIINKLY